MKDKEVGDYFKFLKKNGDMERLAVNSDNNRAPIHRWFPFLVGFSHNLVRETVEYFKMDDDAYSVFDPFMGSGTAAVAVRESGAKVVGNEVNRFLYDICKVKVESHRPKNDGILSEGETLIRAASQIWKTTELRDEHPLLTKCFRVNGCKKLVALRDLILEEKPTADNRGYFFIALTKSLVKSSQVGINVPYVSWSYEKIPENPFKAFKDSLKLIWNDLQSLPNRGGRNNAKVYLHDSRKQNKNIASKSIDMVFTSPPYLNNFDYGEALKVFLYFWGYAKNYGEITKRMRKASVTSATTCYSEGSYLLRNYEQILGKEFVDKIPKTAMEIINRAKQIRKETSVGTCSRKSFDLLTVLYFKDMFLVLKELCRVLKDDGLCFIIVGDSAPYGVHVPTDNLLGEIGKGLGFSNFAVEPIRERGVKWKILRYRHSMKLRESILALGR